MIIRYAIKCETCNQAHTVRIGMGQEESQTHKFPCRNCGEEISLRMDVDYINTSTNVQCVENCLPIAEVVGAPIVNVDANFLIPPDDQDVDFAFPRLSQFSEMMRVAEKNQSLVNMANVPLSLRNKRPFRRPDYAEEWKKLKKAWSLARSGNNKLSNKRIAEASDEYYGDDNLNDLADWIWRFSLFICQPAYEPLLQEAMKVIQPLAKENRLTSFSTYYAHQSEDRGTLYFNALRNFFAAYSELGQVYFFVCRGVPIPSAHRPSSVDFESVKMLYGNAYETFASLVDILALLNNVHSGRQFDQFQQLTLDEYKKLDKSGRFGPFSGNPAFAALCAEADNRLRNASHHGSMRFDVSATAIKYRTGKGSTGPEQVISYANYLERCVRINLQILTLLRIELLLSKHMGVRPPI